MAETDRKTEMNRQFERIYGRAPEIWARAPGRVDLMGSHTDYNLGYVMTMTIDRDVWIAAAPRPDGKVCVHSLNLEGGGEFDLAHIERDLRWPWTDYVRGVAQQLAMRDCPLRGLDALIHSTVPVGSGLSSSAALEMAAGVVFRQAGGFALDPVELALLGQKAENGFVGVNCRILDQYSSALGRAGCALLLDYRSLETRNVPIAPEIQVVIGDTRAKRTLSGCEYGERRA
ncbi:MAG TPA: galactokinase family protein [Anaerolineaceae bacterium]|nr:galactokinase family protein [Anaerolineaceae bacterium]